MNVRPPMFGIPNNPLAQVLSLLVFGALLVVAVVMGAVLLAAVFGFAVLAWIAFSVRVWWLRRKFAGRAPRENQTEQPGGGRLIEAEYIVVSERDARRPPSGDDRSDDRHDDGRRDGPPR